MLKKFAIGNFLMYCIKYVYDKKIPPNLIGGKLI